MPDNDADYINKILEVLRKRERAFPEKEENDEVPHSEIIESDAMEEQEETRHDDEPEESSWWSVLREKHHKILSNRIQWLIKFSWVSQELVLNKLIKNT